ncbi:hypothetical protein MKW98_014263 [Papaver atlanticum]|uniref:Uncharacterized protein n=1 Tax=Papaver atlanticum TaxID=357466 RepID=A0AAD4SYC2_9MAGN|nr:hypothetical protein MKW98_014263 [Papaver atlanticum]
MIVVWNIATVVTVLEKDYGRKALAKSMRLIVGKIWVSCAVFSLLEIAFTGIIFTFVYLVVYGNKMSLVGKVFVGIGCYLLMTIWIHFSLVVHTVVYFVCKSYHNEDISTVTTHSEVPVIQLGRQNDVQLERVPV